MLVKEIQEQVWGLGGAKEQVGIGFAVALRCTHHEGRGHHVRCNCMTFHDRKESRTILFVMSSSMTLWIGRFEMMRLAETAKPSYKKCPLFSRVLQLLLAKLHPIRLRLRRRQSPRLYISDGASACSRDDENPWRNDMGGLRSFPAAQTQAGDVWMYRRQDAGAGAGQRVMYHLLLSIYCIEVAPRDLALIARHILNSETKIAGKRKGNTLFRGTA